MTIYILYNSMVGNDINSIESIYTDLALAQHECDSYNLINTTEYYMIKPIELTTDAFMELTLQPHKPRPFKEFL